MIFLIAASALGATVSVEMDASGDFTSIQPAIAAAGNGDEILIGEGTWYEAINLGIKHLTLSGSGSDLTILDASGTGASAVAGSGMVTLSGITVLNEEGQGISVQSGADFNLADIVLDELGSSTMAGSALFIDGATVTITDSLISAGLASTGMVYLSNKSTLDASGLEIRWAEAIFGGGIFALDSTVILDSSLVREFFVTYSGGAVYLEGAQLYATDTDFSGNLASGSGSAIQAGLWSHVELVGGTVEQNYGDQYGTVNLANSTGIFTDTLFVDNDAYYGGALFAETSTLTLENTKFEDNYALYGGGMYLSDTTLVDTASQWIGNVGTYGGGAAYSQSTSLQFQGSYFAENDSTDAHGGGLYNYYPTMESYQSVTFEDNNNYYGGGAIYSIGSWQPVIIESSSFSGNNAMYDDGGAILFEYGSLIINSSTFSFNENWYNEGGALATRYSDLRIDNTTFNGNRAYESNGGGVYSYGGYALNVTDSVFSSNAAALHGGGIYVSLMSVELSGNWFNVNDTSSVGMGGALYLTDVVSVYASNNTFSGNNAGYGGAFYLQWPYSEMRRWENNIFVENSANIGGVAVWVGASTNTFNNNTLLGNSSVKKAGNIALVESSVSMINNIFAYSTSGAAIFAYDDISAKNSVFEHNAFYQITDGVSAGSLDPSAIIIGSNLNQVNPDFAAYSPDGQPDNDSLVLLRDSALIDAGDPKILDPDGSISDIGVWGGPGVLVEDVDKDGYDNWIDCDDSDPSAHPDGTEVFYDGVNSDCLSGSDYDGDGDGEEALEYGGEDCDDTDPALIQNCDEDDEDDEDEVTGFAEPKDRHPLPLGDDGESMCGCETSRTAMNGMGFLALLAGLVYRRRRENPC